jgi:hypothetical protein
MGIDSEPNPILLLFALSLLLLLRLSCHCNVNNIDVSVACFRQLCLLKRWFVFFDFSCICAQGTMVIVCILLSVSLHRHRVARTCCLHVALPTPVYRARSADAPVRDTDTRGMANKKRERIRKQALMLPATCAAKL